MWKMILNPGGIASFSFVPNFKSQNGKVIRMRSIEGITGLRNIDGFLMKI